MSLSNVMKLNRRFCLKELIKLLEYIHSLRPKSQSSVKDKIWDAYLQSEQERQEVYQRLANS